MAVFALANNGPIPGDLPARSARGRHAIREVKVTNPASFWRKCETVELNTSPGGGVGGNVNDVREFSEGKVYVMDGLSSRILDSQAYISDPRLTYHDKLFLRG